MPGPIQPSMRKVLDEIAASQHERDTALASAQRALPGRTAAGRRHGIECDAVVSARWQRLDEHLEALRHEAAEQTRLLREILGRLPASS
jgi:hypothetical protein